VGDIIHINRAPKADRLFELAARLGRDEFLQLQPFGRALSRLLTHVARTADRDVLAGC
jgi:hypothetical protein